MLKNITARVLSGTLLVIFACVASIFAQQSGPLFRYTYKNGNEVYAARKEARKELDAAKNVKIIQMLGYVYLEPHEGTVPLYQLRNLYLDGLPKWFVTTDKDVYDALIEKKNDGAGWKPEPMSDGIVGYVSETGGNSMRAAWGFKQKDVDYPWRFRFAGQEYQQWKKLKGVEFQDKARFYIWNDKPVPLLTGGLITTPIFTGGISFMDQTFRKALYENGKTYLLDPSRHYATPDKPLTLYRKDAVSCNGDQCTFHFGFFIMRNKAGEFMSTVAELSNGKKKVQNSTGFNANSKSTGMVLSASLHDGSNQLTVTLKPYNKKDDSDATNNTFTVEVILLP